jgi:dTDP-4-amino-4,6-dideoxygalactose transaminase
MAIPFFSIDFRKEECWSLTKGLVPGCSSNSYNALSDLISDDFKDFEVILFPSARMAFFLTLQELFEEGDEIIFPVLGFPLYVKIALQLGLKPKLVDVEARHLTMDPSELKQAISQKTKGIVVTHLFGHPAKMDEIKAIATEHDVPIIEDCAQSYDSSYKGSSTGTFGHVGIFSCSLMKVPTTLGGGIMITKDKDLADKIREQLKSPDYSNKFIDKLTFLIKGIVSILNSYPFLYNLCSHTILGIMKNKNPALLRKILYSGMGVAGNDFNVWERPKLADYQVEIGLTQFSRTREMTTIRREHSATIDSAMEGIEGIRVLTESTDAFWNYQYHVLYIDGTMEEVYHKMFDKGIHLMQEDVWDCTQFNFFKTDQEFPIGSKVNKGLIRIPNNSLLNKKEVSEIAKELKVACTS